MPGYRYTFDEIISTVSDKEMMQDYPSKEMSEENQKLLSAKDQRFYLAWYAKAAHEHVNFEGFSDEHQSAFKSYIEDMYNKIQDGQTVKQEDFLREMSKSAEYIEDRHFEIQIAGDDRVHGGGRPPERTTGSNFMYRKGFVPEGYTQLGRADDVISPPGEEKQELPAWEIGSVKKGNEDILIVSVYGMWQRGNDYDSWKDFIEKFDEVYPQYQKDENSRIILDVRGNCGGEDKPIDHVAKRLYGNLVNTYKRCEMKDAALSNYFLHKHGAYKPGNYEKFGLKGEDLVKRSHFSGESRILFDETKTYYLYNPEKGYKGRTDILIDARVASAAESAYSSFYHHPNVRYIGENTQGMQQYTQGTFATPWGGQMRVAVTKLTYWDKESENIEVKGHKPDVNCSGQDSLEVAFTMDRDEGRVLNRKKNEIPTGKQEFAEYDPQAKVDINDPEKGADPRKAYYAITLDPALRKNEEENARKEAEFYNSFLSAHVDDVQNLAAAFEQVSKNADRKGLQQTEESADYNLGTNKKGASSQVAVANAVQFEKDFNAYKAQNPTMPDEEAKARVVFDFMAQHGSQYTYEKDAKTVLFGNITREQFYSFPDAGIFDQACHNTNVYSQNMDVRVITLESKSMDAMPKNTEGVAVTAFRAIPQEERNEIMFKKGFYHEMMHAVTGTDDERKCDAYALLRTMREHPEHAKAIFDVYNMQRSKIGYTINNMSAKDWDAGVARGTMTYLMPETYGEQKLKWFAEHPRRIPNKDEKLLIIVNGMTAKPEFSKEELESFHKLINDKEKLTADAFKGRMAENPVVQKCMKQGGFDNIDAYVESDKDLKKFLSRKKEKDLALQAQAGYTKE